MHDICIGIGKYCVCVYYTYTLLQLGGAKPLHLAALKDNMDVMRILITECGCKADLRDEVYNLLMI